MSSEQGKRPGGFNPFRFITGKIRNKVVAILLSATLGTGFVAAVALYTMNTTQQTVRKLVDFKGKTIELSTEAKKELQHAREFDQQYRLNYKFVGGFDRARELYVDPALGRLDKAETQLRQIDRLEKLENQGVVENVETKELRESALKQLGVYRGSFLELVDILEKRGHKDFGLIGEFRGAVHDIEDSVKKAGLLDLQVTMLMVRRHEKDYLLRGEEKYITATQNRIEELKQKIRASSLSAADKKQNVEFADSYLAKFNQVVEMDTAVAQRLEVNEQAAARILEFASSMITIVKKEQAIEIAEMKEQNQLAFILVIGATVATLVIGVGAAFFFSGRLTKQIEKIMDMFNAIGIGDFSSRAEVVTQDELGEMAESLNAMLDNTLTLIQSREERDAIQASIMNLLGEISDLADGDLTARAQVTEEVTGAIADAFNTMAEQLSQVVVGVKQASDKVNQSSLDVGQVTQKLSELSDTQATKINEAIATIHEMTNSIKQVSASATKSSEVSGYARNTAHEGAIVVQKTNEAMSAIKENMRGTSRTIKRLGESSQEIGNIVQIINDISERTSILALNASIQAAMAGDEGRGFAVVAEEIQRLAERSASSTKQIDTLIRSIQGEISEAGASMEKSIRFVVEGSELADDAHAKLAEIDKVSRQLAEIIQTISESAQRQALESDRISAMMQNVGSITGETTSATRETTVSMEKITLTSKQLRESIMAFKVAEDQLAAA